MYEMAVYVVNLLVLLMLVDLGRDEAHVPEFGKRPSSLGHIYTYLIARVLFNIGCYNHDASR